MRHSAFRRGPVGALSLLALMMLLCVLRPSYASPSGLVSNSAITPETASAVRYVSANGSDASDGLSRDTAKKTIEAAQAALPPSGGTIDVLGGFREMITSGLTIGNGTSKGVRLVAHAPTVFYCNVSRGPCITVADYSSLDCVQGQLYNGADGSAACLISEQATANLTDLVTTQTGLQSYEISGWTLMNYSAGTLSGALLHLAGGGAQDISSVSNMLIEYPGKNGTSLLENAKSHLYNVSISGSYQEGAKPCVVEPSNVSTPVDDITWVEVNCNHPGGGEYALQIDGLGRANLIRGFRCIGCRIEGYNSGGTTLLYIHDAVGITFVAPFFGYPARSHGLGAEIAETASGYTDSIDFINYIFPTTIGGIKNDINGDKFMQAYGSYYYARSSSQPRSTFATNSQASVATTSTQTPTVTVFTPYADGPYLAMVRITATTAANDCTTSPQAAPFLQWTDAADGILHNATGSSSTLTKVGAGSNLPLIMFLDAKGGTPIKAGVDVTRAGVGCATNAIVSSVSEVR